MLKELFPDAKNVGLLYSSGEPNSQYQINIIKPILEGMGYACTAYSFADSNDLASVCTSALNTSDVIYVPTDNTVAGNTEIIRNITGIHFLHPIAHDSRKHCVRTIWIETGITYHCRFSLLDAYIPTIKISAIL